MVTIELKIKRKERIIERMPMHGSATKIEDYLLRKIKTFVQTIHFRNISK